MDGDRFEVINTAAISEDLLELLLLADPSREMLESYLKSGRVYTGFLEGKLVGVLVLNEISPGVQEIKNIAVIEEQQGKGYGRKLLGFAEEEARRLKAKELYIGTGNSSLQQLKLYQQMGFRMKEVRRDFFTEGYAEPLFENGIQCRDMIILSKEI